ncbi:MAG: hypothetical protein ACFB0B_11370 [Thermonemataceae bacterium]
MLLLKILAFIVVLGIIAAIFYVRLTAIRESKKTVQQFERLNEQLNLQLDTTRKVGNEVLPKLVGAFSGRNLLIEKTIRNRFKYLVVSIPFKNKHHLQLQIVPKGYATTPDRLEKAPVVEVNTEAAEKYLLIANKASLAKAFFEERFYPFWQKHQQIEFMFSTLIAYNDQLTLALLAGGKKVKNDLVLEVTITWLYQLAAALEK